MIHYSCDLCGEPIRQEDHRFEVKIEVRMASEEPMGPCDLMDGELGDLFDFVDEIDSVEFGADAYRVLRFDLCHRCHAAYMSDPLFRQRRLGLRHFEN